MTKRVLTESEKLADVCIKNWKRGYSEAKVDYQKHLDDIKRILSEGYDANFKEVVTHTIEATYRGDTFKQNIEKLIQDSPQSSTFKNSIKDAIEPLLSKQLDDIRTEVKNSRRSVWIDIAIGVLASFVFAIVVREAKKIDDPLSGKNADSGKQAVVDTIINDKNSGRTKPIDKTNP